MKVILTLGLLAYSALATPDCYDFTQTKRKTNYMEVLPLMMYYNKVDWLSINGNNAQCGIYTYGDVFFKSYHEKVTANYFVYKKMDGVTCTLDTNMYTMESNTWLYANSMMADQTVCGYFVGVIN